MKLNLMKYRVWIVLFVLALCLFLLNRYYPSNSDVAVEHSDHKAGSCSAKHD